MSTATAAESATAAVNRHLPGLRGDQYSKALYAQGRIIAHVDLDCFYVQVERSLNAELMNKPVAVVQYNPFGDLKSYAPSDNRFKENGSIIAVSYEARAKGVTRIMRGGEAKKKCPEILLVQVPTSHGKADLQIYREASSRILKVLGERYSSVVIERASIDEVYLDVTLEASRQLRESDPQNFIASAIATLRPVPTLIAGDDSKEMKMSKNQIRNGHAGTDFKVEDLYGNGQDIIEGVEEDFLLAKPESWFDRPHYMWSTEDRILLSGALIIRQLREDVFNKLGFTCSAGIAANKMLAKLSSGMHKPNKQTLVPINVIPILMQDLPFSRVQGFGGKLGTEIAQKFGEDVKTMSDLVQVGKVALTQAFGEETANWIMNRAHGIDHDAVQDRALPISIGCSKSFRSTNILLPGHVYDGTVLYWLTELAKELYERMKIDTDANHRRAKQLHVGLNVLIRKKGGGNTASTVESVAVENRVSEWHAEQGISLSKIGRLPAGGSAETIAKQALSMLQRTLAENSRLTEIHTSSEREWGITSLGLSCAQFENIVLGKRSIVSFLQPTSSKTTSSTSLIDNSKQQSLEEDVKGMMGEEEDFFPFLDVMPDPSDASAAHSLLEAAISTKASPEKSIQHKAVDQEKEVVAFNGYDNNDVILVDDLDAPKSPIVAIREEERSLIKQSTSPITAKGNASLLNLYQKYIKDIDVDTFLSLPSDIQQELVNEAMFRQSSLFATATGKSNKPNPISNNKKQKIDAGSSSIFSKWLGK